MSRMDEILLNCSILGHDFGVCVCVYSHLLPSGRETTRQCGNPVGTWSTKGSSYMVRDSMVCQSGVGVLWGSRLWG